MLKLLIRLLMTSRSINGQHIQNFLLCKTKTNKICVDYSVAMLTRITKSKLLTLPKRTQGNSMIVPYDEEAELQKMKLI